MRLPWVQWLHLCHFKAMCFVLFLITYFYFVVSVWGCRSQACFCTEAKRRRERSGTVQLFLNISSSLGPFMFFLLLIISYFSLFLIDIWEFEMDSGSCFWYSGAEVQSGATCSTLRFLFLFICKILVLFCKLFIILTWFVLNHTVKCLLLIHISCFIRALL